MRVTAVAVFVLAVAVALVAQVSAQAPAPTRPPALGPPPQPKRIALLIANSEYPAESDRLVRPLADAAEVQNSLRPRGFVGIGVDRAPTLRRDVTMPELRTLIVALKDAIRNAGPGAIGFFYYAGHGVADEAQTYIVTVDAPNVQAAGKEHRLSIYDVTSTLGQGMQATQPTIVVVIDACRTGLRAAPSKSGAGGAPASGASVRLHEQKPGTLLALSAAVGAPASDSGEYALALARAIGTRGLTIPAMFEQVREEVWQKSQGAQLPISIESLVKKVCLVSCDGTPEVTDPREILAKRGVLWTVDALHDAIRRGDLETVTLFLTARMATDTPDSQGRTLPVTMSLNQNNPEKMIDLLVRSGVSLEARYNVWAPLGPHKKTMLERAVEQGNLRLTKALLARRVRVNDVMETYGQMGVTVKMYPLTAAIHFEHYDVAAALLDAGADTRAGNYAAYKKAEEMARRRPGSAEVRAIVARVAPPSAERSRLDAQPQMAVNECMRKLLAIPPQQLIDEATRFNVFAHVTLGPRECVLAKANVSLTMGSNDVYRPDFFRTQAQTCCEQSFGVRRR